MGPGVFPHPGAFWKWMCFVGNLWNTTCMLVCVRQLTLPFTETAANSCCCHAAQLYPVFVSPATDYKTVLMYHTVSWHSRLAGFAGASCWRANNPSAVVSAFHPQSYLWHTHRHTVCGANLPSMVVWGELLRWGLIIPLAGDRRCSCEMELQSQCNASFTNTNITTKYSSPWMVTSWLQNRHHFRWSISAY